MSGSADRACHDLLLGLAGRLPDELLWRLRDWLAAGARGAVGAILPRELVRNRVGLTDDERVLCVEAVGGWGASRRLLDAVLPQRVPPGSAARFAPDAGSADLAARTVLAVGRGYPGCTGLRMARRIDTDREQRVVLVAGADRPWVLTGTLQRVLRVHGDLLPCVEVLGSDGDPPAYHRAALAASVTLWQSSAAPVALVGASG